MGRSITSDVRGFAIGASPAILTGILVWPQSLLRPMRRLVGLSTRSFSASVHYIRSERGRCLTRVRRLSRALTNLARRTRDAENGRGEGVERVRTRRANRDGLERRDEPRREVLRKSTRTRKTMPSTNGHANQWRGKLGSPCRTRTYNPSVNSRMASNCQPLQTQDLQAEAGRLF